MAVAPCQDGCAARGRNRVGAEAVVQHHTLGSQSPDIVVHGIFREYAAVYSPGLGCMVIAQDKENVRPAAVSVRRIFISALHLSRTLSRSGKCSRTGHKREHSGKYQLIMCFQQISFIILISHRQYQEIFVGVAARGLVNGRGPRSGRDLPTKNSDTACMSEIYSNRSPLRR